MDANCVISLAYRTQTTQFDEMMASTRAKKKFATKQFISHVLCVVAPDPDGHLIKNASVHQFGGTRAMMVIVFHGTEI